MADQIDLCQFMKPKRRVTVAPGDLVRDVLDREGVDYQSVACKVIVDGRSATLDTPLRPGLIVQLVPQVQGGSGVVS